MNALPPGSTPGEGRYGEAFFRPDRAGEEERIDFGAVAYDAFTMTRLRALGAGPGWRCLDIGAGTGSVSRVAAEMHVPPLAPGSAISRFWAETWQRGRVAMVSTGLVDDAAVDAAVRYLESGECAALSAGMLTAWGRKPEGPTG
ncbi:hypothetical protein [Streptomyces sp. NPDC054874]